MTIRTTFLIALCTAALPAVAQEAMATSYRLSFRFVESKAEASLGTKNYVLVVQRGARGKLNASRRLPYYTSSKGDTKELHMASLGSIVECTAEDRNTSVKLDCSFESSSVAPDQAGRIVPAGFLPIINSRQVSTTVVVPTGTEAQIARMDDPASGHRLEIFATVDRLSDIPR